MKASALQRAGLILAAAVAAVAQPSGASQLTDYLDTAKRTYSETSYATSAIRRIDFRHPDWDLVGELNARGIRAYEVPGLTNVRDIGGWTGLPTGRVFRGGCFELTHTNAVDAANVRACREFLVTRHGIRVDLNLQSPGEIASTNRLVLSKFGLRAVRCPVVQYTKLFEPRWRKSFGAALRAFADPENYPLYIHCAGGADRTGTVILLVEALCGVTEPCLSIDYELTSFAVVHGFRYRDNAGVQPFRTMMERILAYPGRTLAEKTERCVLENTDLTPAEIAAIRENLRWPGTPWAPSACACASTAVAAVKVSVDASKVRTEISPWLYGTGMEDVNHEIYGGLDAQRLYGESFEEPCPTGVIDRWQCHGVSAGWDKAEALDGADFVRDTVVFHQGKASQELLPNGGVAAIANRGLRRWGVPCRAGKKMHGHVWTCGQVGRLEVALQDYWGEKTYALAEIPTQTGTNWCRAAFALTPSATDAHGRFLVRASGSGKVWLDDACLADEPTNEFGRLGCREDIVAAFRDEGVTFLRWGGSMVNTPEYKLKNMAGRGERRPYVGSWYRESSGGFGPYEFVRMAHAMKLPCSVAINAYDAVEDAVRFATELKRYDTPVFVQIGNEEIVNWGLNPEDSRTMKGVSNYCAAVRRLVPAMRAANPKLKFIQSAMVMGADATNLLKSAFHALDGVVEYWDVHVGVREPAQVRRDVCNADLAQRWLKEWNPKTAMKVVILEENGNNHGLDRALGHAVMLEKAREMGPDMLTSCPANALQPYLHNDNWWDQGSIFFTPTQVWLSPCGQAQKLASAYHRDLLVEGSTDDREVSVSATKSRDGKSLVLHFVNTARAPRTLDLRLAGTSAGLRVVRVLSLSGATPKADNSPAAPRKVVPVDDTADFLKNPVLRPYSYTVVVVGQPDV